MRVAFSFDGRSFTAALEGNATARSFLAMLSLDLLIEDYGHNEKIARLPEELSERGAIRFGNERIGDVCYYAPWKNLAFFHGAYRYSSGLIRIGRIDGPVTPLLHRGTHPLRCEILV